MDENIVELAILKGESEVQDFKLEITSSQKIAKTIVAFANTKGGRLWIGVKDSGKINGCEPLEERYMIEQALDSYCKPPINITFETHEIEDKEILEVQIPYSENRPHYAKDELGKWLAYIRHNDQTVLAGIVSLKSFERQKKDILIKYAELERSLLICINENPDSTLNQLITHVKKPRKLVVLVLSILVAAQIVHIHYISHKESFYIL